MNNGQRHCICQTLDTWPPGGVSNPDCLARQSVRVRIERMGDEGDVIEGALDNWGWADQPGEFYDTVTIDRQVYSLRDYKIRVVY